MVETLAEMFSYTFLVRAFVVGLLVSLCAALLGVSLVLKRYSMIGDGLSHVGFGTLAIATAMNAAPLAVAVPVTVAVAFLLLRIGANGKIRGDAAIALISASSLAVGVIVISQSTGMNTDVCNYLFGSILAMSKDDVTLSVVLAIVVLALFALCYHKIYAVTFDEGFARATGVRVGMWNMLIAFLTAITIVLGMRMMGALLISSLIIFPALSSMRVCKRFYSVTLCAAAVSELCFFVGVVVSYLWATPTGASVVAVNIVLFVMFWAVGFARSKGLTLRKPPRPTGAAVIAFVLVPILLLGALTGLSGCLAYTDAGLGQRSSSTDGTTGAVFGTGEEARETVLPSPDPARAAEVVEIPEKVFLAVSNDIYVNTDDYHGKTLSYEGFYGEEPWSGDGTTYRYVARNGPGCCGYDGLAGFEVVWDGAYPNLNDWCKVSGVLEVYEEYGQRNLRVRLTSLEVLQTRGLEYVSQ
ncbi:MAG: metal ABC transporter permease [Coriobacteriales bacterium]|jgi:zinc transport system permease protein|nr:metal ABC transporter permease [Coriobacteriales bacterium]